MDRLARASRAKNGGACVVNEGLKSSCTLLIRLRNARVLRVMSRSMFLAMLLLALPSLGCMVSGEANAVTRNFHEFNVLPALLRDLVGEGLIKKGQKGFILGDIDCDLDFLRENGIEFLTRKIDVVKHHVFDFVFAPQNFQLIDGILKDGGLVISLLDHDPLNQLKNYKIVYLRQFENTVVAMRKMGKSLKSRKQKQVFWGVASVEQKKAALKGLEDVYLEPPSRATLAKKSRKIKFLPDLLKDSLGGYPRRFFISDDSSALDWFYKNYPMRDQEFQVYDAANDNDKLSEPKIVQLENRADEGSVVHQETEVSAWLATHVRREDYVVMKAEAQVVEDMLKDNTINLVDELFLECKHQWQHGGKESRSKRAYWQCLALYGKVRDEGIAVHQWWG